MQQQTMPRQIDLLRRAAQLNCEGASHLGEDELEEAVANFTMAYHWLGKAIQLQSRSGSTTSTEDRQSLIEAADDSDNDEDNGDDSPSSKESWKLPLESVDKYHFILDSSHVSWYAASKDSPGEQSSVQDHTYSQRQMPHDNLRNYVSKEALIFHPESALNPRETPFFEGVILFNIALTYHHGGLSTFEEQHQMRERPGTQTGAAGISGSNYRSKALQFYNMCLRCIKTGNYDHSLEDEHGRATASSNLIVEAHMLIASLNNKAQILFAIGEYEKAYEILLELLGLVAATDGDPPGFEEADIRGLEGTLGLLDSPEISAVLQHSARTQPLAVDSLEDTFGSTGHTDT